MTACNIQSHLSIVFKKMHINLLVFLPLIHSSMHQEFDQALHRWGQMSLFQRCFWRAWVHITPLSLNDLDQAVLGRYYWMTGCLMRVYWCLLYGMLLNARHLSTRVYLMSRIFFIIIIDILYCGIGLYWNWIKMEINKWWQADAPLKWFLYFDPR
jgi:hypothetical protein